MKCLIERMAELYSRYISNEEKIITVDIDETGFF